MAAAVLEDEEEEEEEEEEVVEVVDEDEEEESVRLRTLVGSNRRTRTLLNVIEFVRLARSTASLD